jgi:hypothetical protein
MTIHRLVQNTPLEPEEIERLVAAYGRTLRALGLRERDDPLTQAVAKKIIEIGQSGIATRSKFQNSLSARFAICRTASASPFGTGRRVRSTGPGVTFDNRATNAGRSVEHSGW